MAAACVLCRATKSYRFISVKHNKFKDNIGLKLSSLFNVQVLEYAENSIVCASCVSKTESAFAFVKMARDNICTSIPISLPLQTTATTERENEIDSQTEVLQSDQNDHTYCVEDVHVSKSSAMDEVPPIVQANVTSTEDKEKATLIINSRLRNSIEQLIVDEIKTVCNKLVTKTEERSVLGIVRPMSVLAKESGDLVPKLIKELSTRMPLVYKVFMAIAGEDTFTDVIPSVASAYSLLLYDRSKDLSAFHRLVTSICIEGHMTDEGFTRLNKLGITQSARSKLNLLDECGSTSKQTIPEEIKKNPLVKIVGDNLDIYIRTAHERQSKTNIDLHLFASNLIFSRVASPDMDNTSPIFNIENVQPEQVTLHGNYRVALRNAYIVHISKILLELPSFDWLRTVSPELHFPYERQMNLQTKWCSLPIQHKNENKLEDCIDILDSYEEYLHGAFANAFGEDDTTLSSFKCVVGGDQLTRVRLQEAKHLRNIAINPRRRFEDIHPIVVEMWHSKQDLLEKAYKKLYNISSARQPGTLYHAKSILQRGSVNGKVKSRFKAHHDLFMTLGKTVLKEYLMEFFGMDTEDSVPTKHISSSELDRGKKWMTKEEKHVILQSLVAKFLDQNNFIEFDPYLGPSIISTSDGLYNYCCNLCHWYLQVLEMDDTAKAGDLTRVIPNCMNAIPLFFSHSRLSKYFVENIDYVLKCEFLLSPLQRLRVLEGSFVNLRGGANNNMESDLMQENTVRTMKHLIRQLGANKTQSAIDRTTAAAETIKAVTDGLDCFINCRKNSSKHKIASSFDDERTLAKSLRKCRPFRVVAGRNCDGFKDLHASPLTHIDLPDFRYRVDQVVRRLTYGQAIAVDDDRDEEDSHSDED